MTTANQSEPVPREAFADLLPVKSRFVAPGEYQLMDASGQRIMTYVEGSALAEWLQDRINESIALAGLIEEIRTHYANGCRNNAKFMHGWLDHARAALHNEGNRS